MLYACGVYAQEQKCFTGALVKDASGKKHFIIGDIMNHPADIIEMPMNWKPISLTSNM